MTRKTSQTRADTMRKVLIERGGMHNTGRTRFVKGSEPFNKGKSLTESHKESLRGPRPNFIPWNKGMHKSKQRDHTERTHFRRTKQMQVFKRDNFTCQICYQYSGNLQVDHIKSWAKYPDLRFEIDNCRTLCMACHYYITFKKKIPEGMVWGHNLSRRIES